MGGDATSKIPDFSHYRSKQGSNSNLVFQYFMVGTMGALTAAGAKATVQGMLVTIGLSIGCLRIGIGMILEYWMDLGAQMGC
jgi:ubiquinol-cytochrome c reductase iron-sulfur subunit